MSLFELVLGVTPLVNAVLCCLTCLVFCAVAGLAWFWVVDPNRQEKQTARRVQRFNDAFKNLFP